MYCLVCMFTQMPRTSSATGGPTQYDINLVGKAMALSNKLQTKYAHVFVSRQKVAQTEVVAGRSSGLKNRMEIEQRAIGTL